ncbi:MAG TPA: phosphoglucosamine mutase, partial [Burkholderiales bacterium]|nr:phosphoglucosamine mutase [Burkholderiales bacterium]
TLMTNLALEHALGRLKIPFGRAKVGDRYVLEMLLARKWKLGGENSGHIVCLDKHTTGDAIVSALQVLRALVEDETTLTKAAGSLELYPQVLINVPLGRRGDAMANPAVKRAVKDAESELDGAGRVLLRPSGTEPLIRVMVEGRDATRVRQCAESIAAAVRKSS